MTPPMSSGGSLNLDALSGICGSMSIACWVVVFSPQIVENFRRGSAEGLSVAFIVIWLVGDIFNILGAILQNVLPTMIILAVYYTLADVVLLCQVWWYRGFTLKDDPVPPRDSINSSAAAAAQGDDHEEAERQPLLAGLDATASGYVENPMRDRSTSTIQRQLAVVTSSNGSAAPVTQHVVNHEATTLHRKSGTVLQAFVLNSSAILFVCGAGILGWWVSVSSSSRENQREDEYEMRGELPEFDTLGQVFGYLCAVFYLGSRVPQLLLNYRRKSTEGVSLLFFLFACIGNLTYDMSIFAFNPAPYCERGPLHCASGEQRMIYSRYIAVNLSWIIGSLGTLFLDLTVFAQFFLYRKKETDGWYDNGEQGYLGHSEESGRATDAR